MALSDYDSLAFDTNGKPCTGHFEAHGYSFELYKTWVYMRHESRPKDVTALYEGHIDSDSTEVHIVPSKTLSRGKLVYIKSLDWDDKAKKAHYRRFAGIVCSGYDGNRVFRNVCEDLGVNPDHYEPDGTMYCNGWREEMIRHIKTNKHKVIRFEEADKKAMRRYNSRYVGVTKAGVKELFDFLAASIGHYDEEGKKWLAKLHKAKHLRYNQGDAYFAAHLHTNIPGTAPSKAKQPMAIRMLKKGRKCLAEAREMVAAADTKNS